jgi:hypothetical protein
MHPRPEKADGILDPLRVAAQAIHAEVDLGHVANAHVIPVGAQYGRKLVEAHADRVVRILFIQQPHRSRARARSSGTWTSGREVQLES